jgi:hypothetical protein
VTALLGEVKVTLELADTIYLPNKVNAKLREHELGHAKINTIVYEQDADDAARSAAQKGLARRWKGTGATPDDAGKAATDAAVDFICHEYLRATADKAYHVGDIYDDLTKHGTNAKQVDDAIREAFAKQGAEEK